jgi:hypothetical protein
MKSLLCCLLALSALPAVSQIATSAKTPQPATFTTIYNFAGANSTGLPSGGLIFDAQGNMYGVAEGQQDTYGAAFELSPASGGSWTVNTLYSFQNFFDGEYPMANLVFDAKGNLYGVTAGGGINGISQGCLSEGCGTVFELSPDGNGGWQKATIYEFQGGEDGNLPLGGLVWDAAGNLFGTTEGGGHGNHCDQTMGCGTVFELSPSNGAWIETVLHRFGNGSDGQTPSAGLVFDSQGNLYGATVLGGVINATCYYGCGAIFKLSPRAGGPWIEKLVHLFTGGNVGTYPYATLVLDPAGNLYGSTGQGGRLNDGIIFELTPTAGGGWEELVLHDFRGTDGNSPAAAVLRDAAGNIFGTTAGGGGENVGVAFELSPEIGGKWSFSPLHSFAAATDGAYPNQIILDGQGNLFGTTNEGGANRLGTAFEITP